MIGVVFSYGGTTAGRVLVGESVVEEPLCVGDLVGMVAVVEGSVTEEL